VNEAQRQRIGRLLGLGIVGAALLVAGIVWRLTYVHPRTSDAAVQANLVGIAPHVSGPIVELPIVDNQHVRAGDLLFAVDARPYEARLAKARADLALAEADIAAQRDAIAAAAAQLATREAEEGYAADYLRRVEPLLAKGFVTADHVAEARTRLRAAAATREGAAQERERAEKLLAQLGDDNARRDAAAAALAAAELDVGYCRVVAPVDGYVTNLNIAKGAYTRQGEEVFALVDDRTWYVVADFRETYMSEIRPGMEVEVYLLAYPGRRFRGVVEGTSYAILSGRSVEGLPAVSPTLNWVRLAQRFPVRITLDPPDPEHPYRMGASAVVTIRGDRSAAR
jgi:membrane fusion protein, multidrug efflux system